MCGRYASAADDMELVEAFDVAALRTDEPVRSVLKTPQSPPLGEADYNVAPSKNVRVVLSRPEEAGTGPVRQLRHLTWGLVPSWAKDPSIGVRMTNARAETVLTKPAFRKAARSRRALVPADGWYEWQPSPVALDRGKPRKQPFYMHRTDGVPLAFAGLYEFWRDPEADPADPLAWLATVTIVTTTAEPGLDRIHDRQPLVLEPEDWSAWLDPRIEDEDAVASWLAFAAPGRFAAHPVSRAVGNARTNSPALVEPVGAADLVGVVDPATGEIIGG